jgi:hypothetical protein
VGRTGAREGQGSRDSRRAAGVQLVSVVLLFMSAWPGSGSADCLYVCMPDGSYVLSLLPAADPMASALTCVSALMVKGSVGAFLLISLKMAREAFRRSLYSTDRSRLYTVVSFSSITLVLPSPGGREGAGRAGVREQLRGARHGA